MPAARAARTCARYAEVRRVAAGCGGFERVAGVWLTFGSRRSAYRNLDLGEIPALPSRLPLQAGSASPSWNSRRVTPGCPGTDRAARNASRGTS
eukprot:scaffold76565_cov61-Phaeocystis_antarctica.AAC.6